MFLVQAKVNALHRFCKRSGVVFLGVFGSTARGADRPDSDVDVLVRLAHPKSLPELVPPGLPLRRLPRRLPDLFDNEFVQTFGMFMDVRNSRT
ncbi:MAG: nucleotidyltransferase domain-containing protein [Bacillota bacterium]